MTRIRLIATALFAGSAMLWAQQTTGGWRRVGDPPPVPPETAAPPQSDQVRPPQATGQDPAQPVERTPVDAWGNPQQRNDRPSAPMSQRDGAPPQYDLPAQLTIKPGTFITVRMSQGLSSDRNQEGDVFTATLAQPIVVDGVVVA